MRKWNDESLQRHYIRIKQDAMHHGYTEEELSTPYLDRLGHQTKSPRILKMISLAYDLGKMKGVSEVDEGKTPIVLR